MSYALSLFFILIAGLRNAAGPADEAVSACILAALFFHIAAEFGALRR